MSKASKLGTGSSFQQAQRASISPRRQAIDAATKAPTAGALPPVELSVDVISLNPANPRTELGDLSQLAGSMRDHGQKTAISIMSRFSYVEGNPDHEDELEPDTKYVVIDGNSRLAAAREAGLSTIKVMLDEGLGSNPDEILESALVANIHRQDLDHLDEARALEQLLKVHGTQEALAARLHRSQGWVSQRLALLTLTPELQRKLETGEEPAELLRRVGRKDPAEQEEHLRLLKEKRARVAEERAAAVARAEAATEQQEKAPETPVVPEARPAEPTSSGVTDLGEIPQVQSLQSLQSLAPVERTEKAGGNEEQQPAGESRGGGVAEESVPASGQASVPHPAGGVPDGLPDGLHYGVMKTDRREAEPPRASAESARSALSAEAVEPVGESAGDPGGELIGEPGGEPVPSESSDKPRQIKMPWGDGAASMDIIFAKVFASERHRMIGRYLELLGGPEAFVADLIEASSPEYRSQIGRAHV